MPPDLPLPGTPGWFHRAGINMSDYALQRLNMVESQVRPSDMTDRRVIRAMLALPRETFVPAEVRPVCYMDRDVPLSAAAEEKASVPRFLLAPRTQARLVQALELGDAAIVLDVGCATGYSSAILSRIAQTVVALDEDPQLTAIAAEALAAEEIDNVALVNGRLTDGYDSEGPYDAMLLNGAVADVPPELLDQLKDGGVLVAVAQVDGVRRAVQWRRTSGQFADRQLFDADAPVLPGFEAKSEFVF
ncbi:MAG: protein-L-isoaspartate O-methyltransferase [Pseudomonadota bacterium]